MSGIFGIVALDGGTPRRADIDAMAAELTRRGPDGTHSWRQGHVALGHTLLATTPEALVEVLPLTDEDSGCTITADVRLDNREELIPALDLDGIGRVIGDGELILRAYLKWGEECPAKLLGDFAFAIWDPRAQHLFCARDHMGMRQFNYCHLSGQAFVFATEDTAVLAHSGVPKELNEGRIADLMVDLEGIDFTSTFFESIHRLPPAHSMIVSAEASTVHRYWKLEAGPALRLPTDEAYEEAFLATFAEAVRCRMRSARPISAMLSGGLDSSAVATVAVQIMATGDQPRLRTVSAVSLDPGDCAETRAIHAALKNANFDPIFVSVADLDGISDHLIAELRRSRNPFEVHGSMLRCIYAAARRNGSNVVLDGASGDVILGTENRIASLLSGGQAVRAAREIAGQVRFWKMNRPLRYAGTQLAAATWVAFAPLWLRTSWRNLRTSGKLPGAAPGFARRVGMAERRRRAAAHLRVLKPRDTAWRVQNTLHPNLASGRERYDQLAGSFGVEARDPFMDVRVIQLCLSLPSEQLENGGWPKAILRRILERLASPEVAWRRGKEHLGWTFTTAVLASWEGWQESMCNPRSPLADYLSPTALRALQSKRGTLPTGPGVLLFALDRFLRNHGGTASVE